MQIMRHYGEEENHIKVLCLAPVTTADFNVLQIEDCKGKHIKVAWQGYTNI